MENKILENTQNINIVQKKNSILGIISFASSIAACLSSIILFLLAIYFSDNATDSGNTIMGVWWFLLTGHAFIGGLLGLISLFFANTKKLFGILGLSINGVIWLTWVIIMLLGLSVLN